MKKNERPDLKDYWTINTPRLTNICSQLNVKGYLSAEEEYRETEREKTKFMCAQDYGVLSQVEQKYENFDFLAKAVMTERKLHIRGYVSSTAGDDLASEEDGLVLGSDIASTTHGTPNKMRIRLR